MIKMQNRIEVPNLPSETLLLYLVALSILANMSSLHWRTYNNHFLLFYRFSFIFEIHSNFLEPLLLFPPTNLLIYYLSPSTLPYFLCAGNPTEPKCGFSRKVAEALQQIEQPFGSFDILTDEEVRQGLKEYSNWPTYPQLYVNGELLGGCDIVLEMAAAGELKESIADML